MNADQNRKNISSGTAWEQRVGYSRAVRVGNMVEVSGTTAVNEAGEVIGEGSMYEQAMFIFRKIEKALVACDATLNQVVRTRMYVTDISKWEEAGRAHFHFFRDVKPAATLVEVSSLVNKRLLIEIEVTAVIL